MKNLTKRILECLLVFVSIGTLYFIIECAFKGRLSTISMFVLAGFSGLIFMLLNDYFTYDMDYLLQVLLCALFVTYGELIVGITLNKDYSIWDYRRLPLSLFNGQINLIFSSIWALFATISIPILDFVEWKFFDYKKNTPPYYKVFGKVVWRMKRESKVK